MISLKELDYVNSYPKFVPNPGDDYTISAMDDLEDAYNIYDRIYKNREYNFTFSNGEEIIFEVLPKNLSHMLGIDSKNILHDGNNFFKTDILNIKSDATMSTYDLLTLLLERKSEVLEYNGDNPILNPYRIKVKCRIFNKLSNFSEFNFGCINFNSETYTAITGSKISSNSKKYLYVQSNEGNCPFFMMGILFDNMKPKYIVETLIAPTSPEKYFNGQEVIIPTQILISDNSKLLKLNATPTEKIALLNVYKSIVSKYGLSYMMNINGDYEAMLNDMDSDKRLIKNK